MTEMDWTKGLRIARAATRDVEERLEKEYASPFAYACPSGFISSEKEEWLKIRDIPRQYLTPKEAEMLERFIESHDRTVEEKAAKDAKEAQEVEEKAKAAAIPLHNCLEHLVGQCKCSVCGSVNHAIVSDNQGTGTGHCVDWCVRCGAYERYYDDTRSIIESTFEGRIVKNAIPLGGKELKNLVIHRHQCEDHLNKNGACGICGNLVPEKQKPVNRPLAPVAALEATPAAETARNTELLYTVEEKDGRYYITGITTRSVAEQFGLKHLTVIIAAFVYDTCGQWKYLVIDRTNKLHAQGKTGCKTPNWNSIGGHVEAVVSNTALIGQEIPRYLRDEGARIELSQELVVRGTKTAVRIWKNGGIHDVRMYDPYPAKPLIPIGYVTYAGKDNVEISYLYALPVPEEEVRKVFATDDYMEAGEKHNVKLGMSYQTEQELRNAEKTTPNAEVCDAITRLWQPENAEVFERLKTVIRQYVESERK